MPNYDYRCPKCGHGYTNFQKITDETRPACPECGTVGERVISGGAGLIFKGSGFYLTDYGRHGGKDKDRDKEKEPVTASDSAKSDAPKKTESPKEPSKTVKPSKPTGEDS